MRVFVFLSSVISRKNKSCTIPSVWRQSGGETVTLPLAGSKLLEGLSRCPGAEGKVTDCHAILRPKAKGRRESRYPGTEGKVADFHAALGLETKLWTVTLPWAGGNVVDCHAALGLEAKLLSVHGYASLYLSEFLHFCAPSRPHTSTVISP